MLTLLLLVLAQNNVTVQPQATASLDAPSTWSDGHRLWKLYASPTLVAEPSPTAELRAQILSVDPRAELVVDRPTMRLWKVQRASDVLARVPVLRPAFHDVPNAGRVRVPVGLVCGDQPVAAEWREVLLRSGAQCVPNFWYPPVLR